MYHAGSRIANRGTKKSRKSLCVSSLRHILGDPFVCSMFPFPLHYATSCFRIEKHENDLHFARARDIVDA
jgi:hypothetical protein